MRTLWVVLTGLIVAAGCVSPDSGLESTGQPIVAGTINTGDPAIMEVLSFKGNTGARCTATLVTPRVLVLAAHCFVETPGFDRFVFPGNDDRNVPDNQLLPVKTFVYDPQYTTPRQGHDFAIVVLDTPMAIAPLPLNRDRLDQAQGKNVRQVGYGITTVGNRQSGGIKRQNTAPLATVSSLLLSIAPNPHALCEGDSGGPLLYDAGKGESIVGIASFVTNPACLRDSFYQRVDTQLAWLDEQIKKYDTPGPAPADAGVSDGAPVVVPDARPPADRQETDAAPSTMQPPVDARPQDTQPPTDPQPPPPPTKTASGAGCSYATDARPTGIALALLALVCIRRRR